MSCDEIYKAFRNCEGWEEYNYILAQGVEAHSLWGLSCMPRRKERGISSLKISRTGGSMKAYPIHRHLTVLDCRGGYIWLECLRHDGTPDSGGRLYRFIWRKNGS